MTSTISKFKQVKITWVDPCQCDEAWTPEKEILDHDVAECEDVGWIYKKTNQKYGYSLLTLKMSMVSLLVV